VIAAALREQGAPVPPDLLPVRVWPAAAPFHDAFTVLSRARRQGFSGWEAIDYPSIVAYARAHGFADTDESLMEFVHIIQAQDEVFLTEHAALAKRNADAARRGTQ